MADEDYDKDVNERVKGRKRVANKSLWKKTRNKSKKYMPEGKFPAIDSTHKHLRQSSGDGSKPREV